ncbi:MAG: hypothetical protein ACE5JS_16340 [Nitrospinota bacterium]
MRSYIVRRLGQTVVTLWLLLTIIFVLFRLIPGDSLAIYVDVAMPAEVQEAISPVGSMNNFWHNPGVPKYEFSLGKGRQVLKEAGYAWDARGKLYYPPGKTS